MASADGIMGNEKNLKKKKGGVNFWSNFNDLCS
jgi:hypothetical protein